MTDQLSYTNFTRKSFKVEAVQIDEDNIDEVARSIGEVKEKDGKPYIVLDRRIIPQVSRAYLGWWLTKLNDNLRCYSDKAFSSQFELTQPSHSNPTNVTNVFQSGPQTLEEADTVAPAMGPSIGDTYDERTAQVTRMPVQVVQADSFDVI